MSLHAISALHLGNEIGDMKILFMFKSNPQQVICICSIVFTVPWFPFAPGQAAVTGVRLFCHPCRLASVPAALPDLFYFLYFWNRSFFLLVKFRELEPVKK